ncbi:MAG TPA: hypothetical protein VF615_27765 [Longimicrobiaceae bacterium]|jgi:hypothetical protein
MKARIAALALSVLAAALAVTVTPSAAAAQCKWGCSCEGNACGCNSKGSGGRCDAGPDSCQVSGCLPTSTMRLPAELEFTPDGSVVVQSLSPGRAADPRTLSFASFAPASASADGPASGGEALDGRWEYVAPGRAVARHCSGMVVAHYFDRDAAEAARKRSRLLRI